MSGQEMDYLTDVELEKLIADVEEHEMLPCPSYLRQEILGKTQVSMQQKKLQFYAYCFKVCAAAAAAIVLLFTIPVEPQMPAIMEDTTVEEELSFTEELSKGVGSICESLNTFSDMLILRDEMEE